MRFVRAFPAWERGQLWYPGTIGQQPARYVRAMGVLDDEADRIREAERELRRLRDGQKGRRSGRG